MRVDLDELDRLDYANCKACVCMGGCSDLLEAIPDLIAELRAAREFIRVSLADTCSTDYRLALEAYKRATKGDG